MNLNLIGKNALVCGASQGIGAATAIELAHMGANITLMARDAERLNGTLTQLSNNGQQHHQILVLLIL